MGVRTEPVIYLARNRSLHYHGREAIVDGPTLFLDRVHTQG